MSGSELEAAFGGLLGEHYAAEQPDRDAGYDFASRDGRRVIELKLSLQGARDIGAALLGLARVLADRRRIRRAVLVARLPRMGAARVQQEWFSAQNVLRPEIAARLGLVAVAADGDVVLPGNDP